MKKTILLLSFFFLCLMLTSNVYASDVYLVSDNGISISYSDYDKFKLFGLSDDEIKNLDLETYNKYANRNIIEQSYNRINIETTYTVDNGDIVSRAYKRMNELEFKEKVKDHNN